MSIKRATILRCIAAVVVIAAVGVVGLFITYRVADAQKRNYFQQREIQATTAAAAVDYRDVEALTGSARDLDMPAYQRIRAELVRIKQSDGRVRFVYLMRPAGDKLVFLVDAEDPSSTDYSPPGQPYEETKPADLDVFNGKRKPATIVEGPVRDRWGTWLSATAYIKDAAGRPIAALGTDVDIAHALDSFEQVRRLGIIFDIIAMVLLALIAAQWIVWRYNRDSREALRKEVEASAVRLNEELLSADRVKSDFIQLASHELRSPVNALNVAVQTLDRSATDRFTDDEKTLMKIASNGSSRLVDLVDNLLDMTRIEAGDYVIKPIEVDVKELVLRTVQLFEPLAREKRIVLTAKVPDEPVESNVDPQTILRVLENLVSNAIKFTDYGGIVIELRAASEKLLFSIQDTGVGIPDSFKEETFKKFSQLDRPSVQGTQGAGMGLALCKSVVEAQCGRIWFDSVEGQGTTFYVEIPRFQSETEGAEQQ
ncbi:MAG: sensor histidine kinase [Candidatus Geothermincolia bacterium]